MNKQKAFLVAHWLVLVGAALFLLLSVLSVTPLLDACREKATDTEELGRRRAQERMGQLHFFTCYICSLIFLSLSQLNTLKRSGVLILAALLVYVIRFLVYITVVKSLSPFVSLPNCGTEKSISGHSHMYTSFLLSLIHLHALFRPAQRCPLLTDIPIYSFYTARIFWFMSVVFSCIAIYTSALQLNATHTLGYHSIRQMALGTAIGLLTFSAVLYTLGAIVEWLFPAWAGVRWAEGEVQVEKRGTKRE